MIILLLAFTASAMFFSVNTVALRIFSRVKLHDRFAAMKREEWFEDMINNEEDLTLVCAFLRIVSYIGIILTLLAVFDQQSYYISLILCLGIFALFGLAIPHSWSKYAGESFLAYTYPLLKILLILFKPLLFTFHVSDDLVRRLSDVQEKTADQAQDEKQEELLSLVEEGRIEGAVDEEELDMIEGVLELAEKTVEEIMTPRTDIIAIPVESDLEKVLNTINEAGHSRIPVYRENIDNVIGLVYAKDLLNQIGKDSNGFSLRKEMRETYFVPETKLLRDLLHEFQEQKLHMAIVLDEYGGTAGIVTIEDILEELVGEIVDEYEQQPEESFRLLSDNVAEVDARMYIDDINEEFEVELPDEEDYDTIGGFVFSYLGYIPKTGESFEYKNLRFTIIAAETRKIKYIRLEKLAVPDETGKK
jgi:CBS domain containing-hemolysin-like protein